jgi:hypothetical protein
LGRPVASVDALAVAGSNNDAEKNDVDAYPPLRLGEIEGSFAANSLDCGIGAMVQPSAVGAGNLGP